MQGAITGAAVGIATVMLSSVPIVGPLLKIGAGIKALSRTASLLSGLGHGIFTGDWNRLENAGKIILGDFYLDENKTFFGGIWEGISRHTWQAPQNVIGESFSHYKNAVGNVDRVDYFGGATFVTNEDVNRQNGVSIGNFININFRREIDDRNGFDNFILGTELYRHEYGHYVQSQDFGLSYLFAVGIPSLHSAATSSSVEHGNRWYERQADRYAERYFKKHFGV